MKPQKIDNGCLNDLNTLKSKKFNKKLRNRKIRRTPLHKTVADKQYFDSTI